MNAELWGISYSPWTNKARWALDHHRIKYDYHEHIPMITTPIIRMKTLNFFAKITVPTLIHEGKVFADSWEIARYAESIGKEMKLFPDKTLSEILDINEDADILTAACRVIATDAVSKDEKAKEEALPRFIPGFMRSTLTPIADLGAAYLGMKYDFRHSIISEEKKKVRAILEKFRKRLPAGKAFVFDSFTYADIIIATSLGFVSPVSDRYIKLGSATRKCFTQPEIAADFTDLIEWRDKIYSKYR